MGNTSTPVASSVDLSEEDGDMERPTTEDGCLDFGMIGIAGPREA